MTGNNSGTVKIACPSCKINLEFELDDFQERSGTTIPCPECSTEIRLPNSKGTPKSGSSWRKPTKPCVGCGDEIYTDALICTSCGTNQKTGKKLSTVMSQRGQSDGEGSSSLRKEVKQAIWFFVIVLFIPGAVFISYKTGVMEVVVGGIREAIENKTSGSPSLSGNPNAQPGSAQTSEFAAPSFSIFGNGKEDDQFYEYTKVKAGNIEAPQEKAQLLQSYLDRYPSGRHAGEIKALLEIAQKEVAKPKLFSMTATVRAFTMKGCNWPSHSITFELLVNGEKVRTLDSQSVSAEFTSVPVKVGDVLTGRALWRNGYGAVAGVNETPKETTHTVTDSDKGNAVSLQTYEGGLYLGREWW